MSEQQQPNQPQPANLYEQIRAAEQRKQAAERARVERLKEIARQGGTQ
jgi:hypothetical protein